MKTSEVLLPFSFQFFSCLGSVFVEEVAVIILSDGLEMIFRL